MMRTYKYRLLPRKAQHARLVEALDHSRDLYNAALEERIGAYRKAGLKLNYMSQCRSLTEYRATSPTDWSLSLQRWPLKRLDDAFKAFFRRLKAGEKPGYPRFRGRDWFNSFGFSDGDGWSVDGSRLRMKGIGRVRLHLHRPLPSAPTACQIKRDAKGWIALLVCEVEATALPSTGRTVGLDVGISSFVATSDGDAIPGFKAGRRAQAELRRRQRALARCKKGSRGRRAAKVRVARLHQGIANERRTFQHQIAARFVRDYDLIAIEDLNVKGIARSSFARDVHDAGWTSFAALLIEKAESAGRSVVKVDPRYTSQTCPSCGQVKAKTLAERIHECDCGCVLDRDVAAAKVILQRAVARPRVDNLEAA